MQPRSPVWESRLTANNRWPIFWDSRNPAGYANRMGTYKTRVEYEFIREHFLPAPARVLDIAGGSGRFASKLLDDGYDVTVNDIDPPSLKALRERCLIPGPRTLLGDFLRIDVREQFDCALAIECLEKMPFKQAIGRAHRVLKQGGVLVLTVLNSASWRFAARQILGRAPHPEYVMKTQEYLDACTGAGFDILALRGFMWMPFVVNSNSFLVPLFDKVEHLFRLSSVHSQSPWLLIAARRRD
jgi:SAM-dependent methyltransferase